MSKLVLKQKAPKAYLAAPFFNEEQAKLVSALETVIVSCGWRLFSPRNGENAIEMNTRIGLFKRWQRVEAAFEELADAGIVTNGGSFPLGVFDSEPEPPSRALRLKVFTDNWTNIDDADLVLAVTDGFDVGTMWETGYAYARHVPIVTTTGRQYGCNLMLAHSIVGHTKSLSEVEDVLRIGNPSLGVDRDFEEYGAAIAQIQQKYGSELALREGPQERN